MASQYQAPWPSDGSLPEHVQEYLEWYILPEGLRDPPSSAAWAERYGYNPSTLQNWRKDKRFRTALRDRLDELNISPDRVQEVVDSMFREAKNGNTKAAELYLRYIDRLTPNRVVIEDRRLETLSDEELEQELAALLAKGE